MARGGPVGSRWTGRLLDLYAGLVLLYLFLPIFVIVSYSFNKPAGKFNFVWKSFSLDAWRDPFLYPALVDAMKLSLKVASVSTSVSVVFGSLIVFFLIVEPHGLARLWSIAKEKLRLWPFPH